MLLKHLVIEVLYDDMVSITMDKVFQITYC